ncbi:MAG TPA: class I SAM-dependent methyltransferase [Thermoanaerobaculia bacterium]|nr:class I SAM-dependent methyltransferase [Thermoanaerobaculia bacterium]
MVHERQPSAANDQAAARFWDREAVAQTLKTWMAHPAIQAYINIAFSGSPSIGKFETFLAFLHGRTFARGLSVGCGTGGLERALLAHGVCEQIDAFDGSPESLRIAREEAAKAGAADRVHYFAADFNEPRLPPAAYDIVFVNQAMHHVAKLEKLYRAILRTLKPDGLLYLDEYIGPSRHDWTDDNFARHRAVYDALPTRVRLEPVLPFPIQVDDPSEAIRSSEIIAKLQVGFDVIARVDYGGTLLAPLYPFIEPEDAVVERLIEIEREWLRNGAPSYYTTLVAKPKEPRFLASARYFVVPKLKRIAREITRSGSPAPPSLSSCPPTPPSSPRGSAGGTRGGRSA